mmetsp:Transcript_70563/g.132023  ORF Transcript_70563/g.132023 Transcript_70563/m.132023 type:complete len:325 (+) Transcript_70563:170-1144(+)
MGCAASTAASAPAAPPATAVVQINGTSGGSEASGARPVAIAQLQRPDAPSQPSAPQQSGGSQQGAPPAPPGSGMGGNNASGMRSDLHQLPVRRALVQLKKEECSIERAEDGWFLNLRVNTLAEGEAVVHFLATVTEASSSSSKGALPQVDSQEVNRQRFSVGMQQQCRVKLRSACAPEDFKRSLDAFKEGAAEKDESKKVVVVDLIADSADKDSVVAVRSELRLNNVMDAGSSTVKVVQQWVKAGDHVVKLEALFGTLARRSQGEAEESGECVICLTKPREVAILHCRHVCLCRSCAMITSSTWTIACPVCRGHVAGMCCEKAD